MRRVGDEDPGEDRRTGLEERGGGECERDSGGGVESERRRWDHKEPKRAAEIRRLNSIRLGQAVHDSWTWYDLRPGPQIK